MADVIQKVINANDVHNGACTVGTLPTGQHKELIPFNSGCIVNAVDISSNENKYTNRFNKDYYFYNT